MNALDDMKALLQAMHNALDLPDPATMDDRRSRDILLDRRASDVQIMLDSVIRGGIVAHCTAQLLRWTAQRPVTYTVFVPVEDREGYREGQLAEQRHQLEDPPEPPPAVDAPPLDAEVRDEQAAVTAAAAEPAGAIL